MFGYYAYGLVHGLVIMRSDDSGSVPCKGCEISMGLRLALAVRGMYITIFPNARPIDQEYI